MLTEAQAWQVLQEVPDPELPAVSVCELGIVREVHASVDGIRVVVTPTYSGCPATEMIDAAIRAALAEAGAGGVTVEMRLSPTWTSDWITSEARAKLHAHGIAPPQPTANGQTQPLRFIPPSPACPRCGARNTVRLSEFGSTACKALYRCEQCREPFEYFKPI
ncbi:MAG TPA: 1,2-phenylacetyl-CoA epoxidase subunit PaaD [Burkholderiales bacterium]|nr:1,2-phenylacetyl-CoA epoxidase subunit PaaD [Burkholderiales bacterium]